MVRKDPIPTKGADGFTPLLAVTNISLNVLSLGADMKSFTAAVAFACISVAIVPAIARGEPLVPSDKFPGWATTIRETGTLFFYCISPKICGEGSIVSLHMHDQPAPRKSDIRAKYNEPRLPITCRSIGKYDSCEYPAAIDKKGRPTHFRPMTLDGIKADFLYCGHLSKRVPAGSEHNFLISIVSSAVSYQRVVKNYSLFRSAALAAYR